VLQRREQDLFNREQELIEREINFLIAQQTVNKPTLEKRKGQFKKSHLKLVRSGGEISNPSSELLFLNCLVTFYTLNHLLLKTNLFFDMLSNYYSQYVIFIRLSSIF